MALPRPALLPRAPALRPRACPHQRPACRWNNGIWACPPTARPRTEGVIRVAVCRTSGGGGRVLRGFRPREYALPHRSRVGLGPLGASPLEIRAPYSVARRPPRAHALGRDRVLHYLEQPISPALVRVGRLSPIPWASNVRRPEPTADRQIAEDSVTSPGRGRPASGCK